MHRMELSTFIIHLYNKRKLLFSLLSYIYIYYNELDWYKGYYTFITLFKPVILYCCVLPHNSFNISAKNDCSPPNINVFEDTKNLFKIAYFTPDKHSVKLKITDKKQ